MSEELKACPFCGSSANICSDSFDGQKLYFVSCEDCGVITPCYDTEAEAAAIWNNRA